MRRLLRFTPLLVLLIATTRCLSCTTESGPSAVNPLPDGGSPEAGTGGGDGGSDTGPVSLQVTVYERTWPDFAATTKTPLSGISMTADLPDGTRVVATTDSNGVAVFPNVSWSSGKGTATVTAYRSGSPLVSRLGITRDKPVQRMWVRAFKPTLITVSGTVTNFDPSIPGVPNPTEVVIESPQSSVHYQNLVGPTSNNFQLQVPIDTPFTLVAATFTDLPSNGDAAPAQGREENSIYTGWVRKDFPASSTDIGGAVLDFSQGLTPQTTHGTIELSSRRSSRLYTDAEPYFQVSRIGNIGFFGASSRTILSADGFSASYAGPYVTVDGVTEVNTEFQLQLGSGFSYVRLPGYPVDGADVGGFLEEPQLVQPSDPTVAGSIKDPIVWQTLDPEARGTLLLDRGTGFGIIWELTSASAAPVMTVPKLPDALDASTVLGVAPLNGFIQLGADCDPPDDPWYWSCLRGSMQTKPLFLISPTAASSSADAGSGP